MSRRSLVILVVVVAAVGAAAWEYSKAIEFIVINGYYMLGYEWDQFRLRHEPVPPLVTAVQRHDVAEVRRLLEAGADANVNYPGLKFRRTPVIHYAARSKADVAPQLIKLLVAHGADPDAYSQTHNTTPLVGAVGLGLDSNVQALIDWGAEIEGPDGKGEPLLIAADSLYDNTAVVAVLLEAGANPNVTRWNDTPVLTRAVQFGRGEVARLLVEGGAAVDAVDRDQRTALTWAAGPGSRLSIVKLLVDHGADVNARDNRGTSPLMSAARGGNVAVLRLLLDAGADPHAVDLDGLTAYLTAQCGHHEDAMKLLRRRHPTGPMPIKRVRCP